MPSCAHLINRPGNPKLAQLRRQSVRSDLIGVGECLVQILRTKNRTETKTIISRGRLQKALFDLPALGSSEDREKRSGGAPQIHTVEAYRIADKILEDHAARAPKRDRLPLLTSSWAVPSPASDIGARAIESDQMTPMSAHGTKQTCSMR